MSYDGPFPLPLPAGGTDNTQLTPGPLASDGTTVFGNTIDSYSLIAQRPTPNELQSIDSVSPGFVLTDNGSGDYPSFQAVGSVTPTPGDVVLRDANGNAFANDFVSNLAVTTSAGTTTTLTAADAPLQRLVGTTSNQTYTLPDATTLTVGWVFEFYNDTTSGSLVIKNHGGATLASITSGAATRCVNSSIAGANGTWDIRFLIPSNGSWGSSSGLSVPGPFFAGTLGQFQVSSVGVPTVPLTGVLTGNGASAVTANTVTQHGILLGGASNAVSSLGVALNGQIPIGSSGADPVIAAITAGNNIQVTNGAGSISIASAGATRVLLSTQTASNVANIAFTSGISSTYPTYELVFYNVYPVTNTDNIAIQFSTDGGSTYIATNYIAAVNYVPTTGITWVSSNTTTGIRIMAASTGTTTNVSGCGNVRFFNFSNGGLPAAVGDCVFYSTTGTSQVRGLIDGVNTANTTINAFQIICSTGNISTGTFELYGLL